MGYKPLSCKLSSNLTNVKHSERERGLKQQAVTLIFKGHIDVRRISVVHVQQHFESKYNQKTQWRQSNIPLQFHTQQQPGLRRTTESPKAGYAAHELCRYLEKSYWNHMVPKDVLHSIHLRKKRDVVSRKSGWDVFKV